MLSVFNSHFILLSLVFVVISLQLLYIWFSLLLSLLRFFFISSFVLFFTFTVYILDGNITWFSSWRVPRYKCIFIFLKVLIIFPHFSSNVTAKYLKVVKSRIQNHCVKSAQMRSYFWSVFSCIRAVYGDLLGPEITPYLDTFFIQWYASLQLHC